MRSLAWISPLLYLLIAADGCVKKQATIEEPEQTIARTSKVNYVRFNVQPTGKQTQNHWMYRCQYSKDGKVARFSIQFSIDGETVGETISDMSNYADKPHVQFRAGQKELRFKSGRGSIVADPTSDASVLLRDLQVALESIHPPSRKIRIRELPFEFAILGENMTHSSNERVDLVDSDHGRWVAAKLFIGPTADETQIFFNFEAGGGEGEFSLKDPEYGDKLVTELAKVL